MYKNHFGLERRIFRGNTAGADVFVGPQTASVVQGIKKALTAPDAVVTLTGPVGCGKSTAVAHALGAISGKNAIVRVGRFPLQRGELLDLLFDHMRIQQRPQRGNQKLALFRTLLFNLAKNESRMFILVEDAPFLGPDMLAELEVVTAADTGPSDGAAIVLMGDDYLKELLASKPLARLRQRVRLRRGLEPCGTEELGGYLRHCFRRAGGDFDKVFSRGTAELLHELSGGILRVVNNLVESSLEAAAETRAPNVSLDLISRIANEEFGLTGKFTRLPEISSKQPEPKHSDSATAELVALSMPGGKAQAEPVTVADDDDIPELIQDTQPALAILSDALPTAKAATPKRSQGTLPDIKALSAALGAETALPEPAPAPKPPQQPEARPRPALSSGTVAGKPAEAERKPAPKPVAEPRLVPSAATGAGKAPERKPAPKPTATAPKAAEPKPGEKPEPKAEIKLELKPQPEPELQPDPDFELPLLAELELEQEPEPSDDEPIPTLTDATGPVAAAAKDKFADDERPAWDRDPTLAELRPDLDALERAMAVAHGRDTEAPGEAAPTPEPSQKKPPANEIEDIPEITLDDSINRKVDIAALESNKRLEKEGIVEDDEAGADQDEGSAEERAHQEKSAAELEKIAQGLSKAKTIEDVDDKMAETLFGEELSVAAAAVAARVAEEAAAEAAKTSENPSVSAIPAKSALEKEFENVWGQTPDLEVSMDSEIEDQKGGMDISASRRLATVRALNTGRPGAAPAKASTPPAPKPGPIEEQITTSLTQTMKALKVNLGPAAINDDDDDDDDERKGGFFSRFRRS